MADWTYEEWVEDGMRCGCCDEPVEWIAEDRPMSAAEAICDDCAPTALRHERDALRARLAAAERERDEARAEMAHDRGVYAAALYAVQHARAERDAALAHAEALHSALDAIQDAFSIDDLCRLDDSQRTAIMDALAPSKDYRAAHPKEGK